MSPITLFQIQYAFACWDAEHCPPDQDVGDYLASLRQSTSHGSPQSDKVQVLHHVDDHMALLETQPGPGVTEACRHQVSAEPERLDVGYKAAQVAGLGQSSKVDATTTIQRNVSRTDLHFPITVNARTEVPTIHAEPRTLPPPGNVAKDLMNDVFRIIACLESTSDQVPQSDELFGILQSISRSLDVVIGTVVREQSASQISAPQPRLNAEAHNTDTNSSPNTTLNAIRRMLLALLQALSNFNCDDVLVSGICQVFISLIDGLMKLSHIRAKSHRRPKTASEVDPLHTTKTRLASLVAHALHALNHDSVFHRAIFESITSEIVQRLGDHLHQACFDQSNELTSMDQLASSADKTTDLSIKNEVVWLIPILKVALTLAPSFLTKDATPHRPATASQRSDDISQSQSRRTKARTRVDLQGETKQRLQATLTNAIFRAEAPTELAAIFTRYLLRPPAINEVKVAPVKVRTEGVKDWLINEMWQLIGWDILQDQAGPSSLDNMFDDM